MRELASSDAPVAMITGVGGQDGTYLAQSLVTRGWKVHGITRPGVDTSMALEHLAGVVLRREDVAEPSVAAAAVRDVAPDYVFHLAGISSVWKSWKDPVSTTRVNGVSATALLDASLALQESTGRPVVFVNASSAEIFAGSGVGKQNELTPVMPTSPYGVSKVLSHSMVQVYRSRGLAAVNAILYNHESPRRPSTFVTRKITKAAAAIAAGLQDTLTLGDVSIARDWGWAPDYVEAMASMAIRGVGEDFVVATGEAHSIEEFAAAAFAAAGVDDWQDRMRSDPDLVRSADAAVMVGDASKAREVLNWQPSMPFADIVATMVVHDMELLRQPSVADGATGT